MRVATIDIGTNSVLLLVAERGANGAMVACAERATITRLGQGVDASRTLAPEAVARTNACLDDYAEVVRRLDVTRVAVVGTSAMRDARGGEAVRGRVFEKLGVDARVLSGDEEARLTFRGALSGLVPPPDASRDVVVFDIGGGSTEVVRGTYDVEGARVAWARSFDVGSVRMTERHVKTDPPTRDELDRVREDVRTSLGELRAACGPCEMPIGIAGTMTTLAAVAQKLVPYDGARVHGRAMSRTELEQIVEALSSTPLGARRVLPGMEPKRADVIVAGGLVALVVLEELGARGARVSDRGVRWGLAEELAETVA